MISDDELDGFSAGATMDEIGRSLDSLDKLYNDINKNPNLSPEAREAAMSAAYKAEFEKLYPASSNASK